MTQKVKTAGFLLTSATLITTFLVVSLNVVEKYLVGELAYEEQVQPEMSLDVFTRESEEEDTEIVHEYIGEVEEESHSSAQLEPQKDHSDLQDWEVSRWQSLSIPSINVETDVYLPSRKYWDQKEWDLLEKQMQIGLLEGAVSYPHSVTPGRKGTVFIAGHSSPPTQEAKLSDHGSLFSRLPELSTGDEIRVGGSRFAVIDRKIVSPSQTDLLRQDTSESTVKLITCYPVGTTRDRLIVTAIKGE